MGSPTAFVRTRFIAAILVVGFLLAVTNSQAAALSRNGKTREDGGGAWPAGACGPVVRYKFVGSGWTTAMKNSIEAAALDWETVMDRGGSDIVDLRRVTTNQDIDVKILADPDYYGLGDCNGGIHQPI